ncbi:MAG: hypothetical protein ACLFS6_02070 [Methanomassiliicoccales archaeon]
MIKGHLKGMGALIGPLLVLIVLGMGVRLILAPWTSWTFDMFPFYSASMDMLLGNGMYGHANFSYPPLFGMVMYPFVHLLSLFLDPALFGMVEHSMVGVSQTTKMITPLVTHPAFNLAVKLPLIIGDLILGLLLYRVVKEWKGEVWAKRTFILWFLNPLVIWISSVSGQFDVLPALLTLCALLLFIRRNYFLCGLTLGIAFLFKIYPVYLIVFYLAILLAWQIGARERPFWGYLRRTGSLITGSLVSLVVVIPALLQGGSMVEYVLRRTGTPSFGGLNLWFFVPGASEIDSPSVLAGLTTDITLLVIFMAVVAFVLTLLIVRWRGRWDMDWRGCLVWGNILVLASVLLLQPVTNPQHLLWILPFLLLGALWDGRMGRKLYALTVVGLIYFLVLQSFYAFLYPLAVYTPWVEIASLNESIRAFYLGGWLIPRAYLFILASFAGALVLVSLFLPRRYDIIERAYQVLSRRCRSG